MFAIALFVSTASAGLVFAQDGDFQGLPWLGMVLQYIQSLPKVGGIVSEALQIIGAIAAFGTSLVLFLQSVVAIPYFAMKFAGAGEKAKAFKEKADKIINWAKWISIQNVKK